MQIKFLCLNLWEGGVLFDNILQFIHQEQPDILALQEVYDEGDNAKPQKFRSLSILKHALPEFHCHYAPELQVETDYGPIDLGNATFSRFPITATKTVFFDIPYQTLPINRLYLQHGDFSQLPHNLQHVTLRIDDLQLHVVNLHGIWGLDGGDNDRRLQMSQTIVDEVKHLDKVIVAGDFNLRPNTQTIANIEKHLKNIFGSELATSFNMKHKNNPGYASAVVDMIFVSQTIKVREKSCPPVDISDHLPLLCTLDI